MTIRHVIANCFGAHSRRVWRCIVGATWSLPIRYLTLSAQLAAIGAAAGAVVHIPPGVWLQAMSAGVAVGWAIRVIDNLLNEYVVFEVIRKCFVGK